MVQDEPEIEKFTQRASNEVKKGGATFNSFNEERKMKARPPP
jgi:hypothetical protein